VDRWGERRAPGPLEFCYPEARKALVKRYLRYVTKYGYDGIAFYTYVENYGLRYLDEYGFNEPIVQEFRRRHGVDIRTEPFDKEAWGRLRGEYLTQFLRELHTALAKRGKKLCLTLRGDRPNVPQRWLCITTDIPGAGRLHLDWETWVREGLVDELMVWFGSTPEEKQALARRILELAAGKPIEVTVADSSPFEAHWQPFVEAGVTMVSVTAPGYGADRFALAPAGPDGFASPDWRGRAQALADAAAGKLKVDSATVAALASDPQVLVRREAVRALAALAVGDQVPAVEAALADPEASVRIAAASALAKVHGPESPRRLLSALAKDRGFQFKEACLAALVAMKEEAQPVLLEGVRSPHVVVREVCVRALGKGPPPEAKALLLDALQGDRDYRVRYYAMDGLAGYPPGEVVEALLAALDDREPTVHLHAAAALGNRAAALPDEQRQKALAALLRLFREYGDGCRRPDAAWGWRAVGNAILGFGEVGTVALEEMRTQKQDRWLAWAAYQVVHVPQAADRIILCEEKEATETHTRYAPPFPGHRRD
jgi:HEAT repeat protein